MKKYIKFFEEYHNGSIDWDWWNELYQNVLTNHYNDAIFDFNDKYSYYDIDYNNKNDYLLDKILTPMSYHNVNHKNIPIEITLISLIKMVNDCFNNLEDNTYLNIKEFNNFKDWYYNSKIKVYRGVYSRNHFDINRRSFSLIADVAKKFTDHKCASIGKNNPDDQNGYLLSSTITPSDIVIYNNFIFEYEVKLKKNTINSKLQKITKGRIENKFI